MTNKTKNQLERELAEATDEVNRHTSSSVRYELLDGIRQLAQVALTQTGNVETLEAKLAEKDAALAVCINAIGQARVLLDPSYTGKALGNPAFRKAIFEQLVKASKDIPEQSRDGK